MLAKRYLTSVKNVPAIFEKIRAGTAPEKFTVQHLRDIGFASSSDRALIPLLKELGFLTGEGAPTQRYREYLNATKSGAVMAEALREAYGDLFVISAQPTDKDKKAIKGKFKSGHNVSDRVAEFMTVTFYALLKLADLKAAPVTPAQEARESPAEERAEEERPSRPLVPAGLYYNIQIHLPATKDIEVFNAIFRSLRENLLE